MGLFVNERKLRSHHRINLFYGGFALAFAVLTVVFYRHAARPGVPLNPSHLNAQAAASSSAAPASPPIAAPSEGPSPVVRLANGAVTDAPVCDAERL